jgi:hypothetical protein
MSNRTLGKIGVGSWTFPWATGTVQDQRPTSILNPVGVVERTIDIGVHVVHFLDNLPLDTFDHQVLDRARDWLGSITLKWKLAHAERSPSISENTLVLRNGWAPACFARWAAGIKSPSATGSDGGVNFRQVLPEFTDAGVRIALENYEAYSTSDIAAIVREIDNASLGFVSI